MHPKLAQFLQDRSISYWSIKDMLGLLRGHWYAFCIHTFLYIVEKWHEFCFSWAQVIEFFVILVFILQEFVDISQFGLDRFVLTHKRLYGYRILVRATKVSEVALVISSICFTKDDVALRCRNLLILLFELLY